MQTFYQTCKRFHANENDKLTLDIQAYWSFDEFFFYQYNLYEFTRKELIYMDINGDIPFHLLSFAKDDEEYVPALKMYEKL